MAGVAVEVVTGSVLVRESAWRAAVLASLKSTASSMVVTSVCLSSGGCGRVPGTGAGLRLCRISGTNR